MGGVLLVFSQTRMAIKCDQLTGFNIFNKL